MDSGDTEFVRLADRKLMDMSSSFYAEFSSDINSLLRLSPVKIVFYFVLEMRNLKTMEKPWDLGMRE